MVSSMVLGHSPNWDAPDPQLIGEPLTLVERSSDLNVTLRGRYFTPKTTLLAFEYIVGPNATG